MTMTTWWSQDPAAPPPPPPPPPAPTPPIPPSARAVRRPSARRTLTLLVLAGAAFDGFARSGYATLGAALFIVALAVLLLGSGSARNPQSVVLAVAAVAFGCVLALRTSTWLIPLDLLAAMGLLALAASYARGGSVVGLTAGEGLARTARAVTGFFFAPAHLLGLAAAARPAPDERRRDRWIAIGRGVGLAVPVLVVLGALLASADAVFGSLFHIPVDPVASGQHLVLVAVGTVAAAALLADAACPVPARAPVGGRPLGATEASIVLGGLVLLYATFAGVQVVVAARGEDYVRRTVGVTYAEHARQGFFQLLAVAGLTLAVLVALRACTAHATRAERVRFVVLAELAVALTLVIVAVAIVRLGLYEQAFGLTMLRLVCTWFAWWLGIVFVITGIALTVTGTRRPWLLSTVAASFLVMLLACTLSNPEAVVVERNVARAHAVGRLDTDYLTELSDDAVPALAASLAQLPASQQDAVRSFICFRSERGRRTAMGRSDLSGLRRNVSAVRADAARARVCASR